MPKKTQAPANPQGLDLQLPGIDEAFDLLNGDRAALKLLVSQIILELYKEDDFVLEIDDDALVGKVSNRIAKLEKQLAELRALVAGKEKGKA